MKIPICPSRLVFDEKTNRGLMCKLPPGHTGKHQHQTKYFNEEWN